MACKASIAAVAVHGWSTGYRTYRPGAARCSKPSKEKRFPESKRFAGIEGKLGWPEQSDEVWSSNGLLYVRTSGPKDVRVYSLTGQLLHRLEGFLGERSLRLSRGVYIVKLGADTVRKVVMR